MRKYLWIIGLALLQTFAAAAADLLELKWESSESWRDLFAIQRAPGALTDTGALRIPPGCLLQTAEIPYSSGVIRVAAQLTNCGVTAGAENWSVGAIQVVLFRKGEEIGHRDVYLSGEAAAEETVAFTLDDPGRQVDAFALRVANYGRAGEWVLRRIALSVEVKGELLNGDPDFERTFGIDHFFPVAEGVDWDGLPYRDAAGTVELDSTAGFLGGGASLRLQNGATVRSAIFPYRDETIQIGLWFRQRQIKRGERSWAYAGAQVVFFDADGQPVGHSDVTLLQGGDQPWRYYTLKTPSGGLNRQVKSFALYLRVFGGATGTAWFDGVRVVCTGEAERRPYVENHGSIEVDLTQQESMEIAPLWDGVDLSYCTQIAEPKVKRALKTLRAEGVRHLRLREFLQGCDLWQGVDASGEPILDFTTVDRLLDYVVLELGYTLTPTLETTPEAIARDKDTPYFNRYPPEDLALWSKTVERLVLHWLERYGAERVGEWRFECWNEPEASGFFKGGEADFLAIFAAYMDALLRVERRTGVDLQIGTQSGIALSPFFQPLFEQQRRSGNLDELKFVSMHMYGGLVSSIEALPRAMTRMREQLDAAPDTAQLPLYITEYNADTMSNAHMDSNVGAAFNVKVVRAALDCRVAQLYFFSVIDYLYSQEDRHFVGGLGIFSREGHPKAVLNSFRLLNELRGGKRLKLTSANEPFDGIAVRHPDGRITLALSVFAEESPDSSAETQLDLQVAGYEGTVVPEVTWRFVDAENGNPLAEYQKLGSPSVKACPKLDLSGALAMPTKKVAARLEGGLLHITLPLRLNSAGVLTIVPGNAER